jgi:hypothetical protein
VGWVSLHGRVGVVLEWCWPLVGGERRWREKRKEREREGEDLP